MDNSTHNNMSEKLTDYLDGRLDPEEKRQIDEMLSADKNLESELDSLLITREAVKHYGLQQKVASIHQEMMEEKKAPVKQITSARRSLRYAIAIAAGVLLIIAGFVGYNFYTLSSEKIFAANYQSYELNNVRDVGADDSEIESTYKRKDFKGVISFSYERPFTVKENFLRGMAFAEMADNTNTIQSFKTVIEDNKTAHTNIYNDEAEFYLALAYIRNKDFDFALDILKKIQSDPEHLYYNRVSSKLIRQVKMLKWR
jgi:predicted negative regulator of RcsB-dependent stress response